MSEASLKFNLDFKEEEVKKMDISKINSYIKEESEKILYCHICDCESCMSRIRNKFIKGIRADTFEDIDPYDKYGREFIAETIDRFINFPNYSISFSTWLLKKKLARQFNSRISEKEIQLLMDVR